MRRPSTLPILVLCALGAASLAAPATSHAQTSPDPDERTPGTGPVIERDVASQDGAASGTPQARQRALQRRMLRQLLGATPGGSTSGGSASGGSTSGGSNAAMMRELTRRLTGQLSSAGGGAPAAIGPTQLRQLAGALGGQIVTPGGAGSAPGGSQQTQALSSQQTLQLAGQMLQMMGALSQQAGGSLSSMGTAGAAGGAVASGMTLDPRAFAALLQAAGGSSSTGRVSAGSMMQLIGQMTSGARTPSGAGASTSASPSALLRAIGGAGLPSGLLSSGLLSGGAGSPAMPGLRALQLGQSHFGRPGPRLGGLRELELDPDAVGNPYARDVDWNRRCVMPRRKDGTDPCTTGATDPAPKARNYRYRRSGSSDEVGQEIVIDEDGGDARRHLDARDADRQREEEIDLFESDASPRERDERSDDQTGSKP